MNIGGGAPVQGRKRKLDSPPPDSPSSASPDEDSSGGDGTSCTSLQLTPSKVRRLEFKQDTTVFRLTKAQHLLDPFPRCFSVDGEVANLLRTCYGEASGKWILCNGFWFLPFYRVLRNIFLRKIFEQPINMPEEKCWSLNWGPAPPFFAVINHNLSSPWVTIV